jgi:hypothetical protein
MMAVIQKMIILGGHLKILFLLSNKGTGSIVSVTEFEFSGLSIQNVSPLPPATALLGHHSFQPTYVTDTFLSPSYFDIRNSQI